MPIINLVYEAPEQWWWQPWADVFFWLPLKSDVKDYSWNNRDWILTWSWTYENNWLTLTKGNYITCVSPQPQSNFTISIYLKINGTIAWWYYNRYYYHFYWWWWEWNSSASWTSIMYYFNNWTSYGDPLFLLSNCVWWTEIGNRYSVNTSEWLWRWYNIITTRDNWTQKTYINWVLYNSYTWASRWITSYPLYINNMSDWWWNDVAAWDVILATSTRSQSYITDYFNQTKADYWIS